MLRLKIKISVVFFVVVRSSPYYRTWTVLVKVVNDPPLAPLSELWYYFHGLTT